MGNVLLLRRSSLSSVGLAMGLAAACGTPPAERSPDGGMADAGAQIDAGGSDAPSASDATDAPVLLDAVARRTGRFGDDLRIDLHAQVGDGELVRIALALFDLGGAPIMLYDADEDGVCDSNRTTMPLPALLSEHGALAVSVSNLFALRPDLTSIEIAVSDTEGHLSAPLAIEVTPQPQLPLGAACDPTFSVDRCSLGLSCSDGVCAESNGPTLVRAAYLIDPGNVRVLVEAYDVAREIAEVQLDFVDASGTPVVFELGGGPAVDHVLFDVRETSAFGGLFFSFTPGEGFVDAVGAVVLTVRDSVGGTSVPFTLVPYLSPARPAGALCDAGGFDHCVGSVCRAGRCAER